MSTKEAVPAQTSFSEEMAEWIEAFDEVVVAKDWEQGAELLTALRTRAREAGVHTPGELITPYLNTIPKHDEVPYPGDRALERRVESLIRWNAMAMVHRPEQERRRHRRPHLDLCLAGDAAGSWLQPLLPRQLRRSAGRLRLLPGPRFAGRLCARLSRRPLRRGAPEELPPRTARQAGPVLLSAPLADAGFLAVPDRLDGHRSAECDLPGALHALPGEPRPDSRRPTARSGPFSATARRTRSKRWARSRWRSREKLDNLIFVVNCNLQRLDGPVRGNKRIIEELEGVFRGAGWNVIKVIWGADWDELFARDHTGLLLQAHGRVRRRRLPDLQGQGRRIHPRRNSSANIPSCWSWSRT